jgi:hypothetical protein
MALPLFNWRPSVYVFYFFEVRLSIGASEWPLLVFWSAADSILGPRSSGDMIAGGMLVEHGRSPGV